jgi:subtilase family serine protease
LSNNFPLLTLLSAALIVTPSVIGQNFTESVMPASVTAGFARSHAWMAIVSNPNSTLHAPGQTSCSATTNLCYYYPSDVLTAYAIPSIAHGNGGAGMTVAIVDAYYNPQTEADLASFNSDFGLPACTIAGGCLTIVSQTGGSPAGVGFNQGWAQETNLDVQTVHALAPNAKILLVAANSNSFVDLGTGVQYAETHANVVSNSYGGDEFNGETSFDTYYSTSTVPLLFSSGDHGSVTEYPCTSKYVSCVGGTNLLTTASGYRNVEAVWGDGNSGDGGAGGGCSPYVAQPTFQAGFSTCGNFRGVPDISALADPNTGLLIYLGTNASGGGAGLYVFGGTSLAAPLTAAIVATIDTARAFAGKLPLGANLAQLFYQAAANPYYRYRFYDVAHGSSGNAATTGWDKATGLGVALGPALAAYLVALP